MRDWVEACTVVDGQGELSGRNGATAEFKVLNPRIIKRKSHRIRVVLHHCGRYYGAMNQRKTDSEARLCPYHLIVFCKRPEIRKNDSSFPKPLRLFCEFGMRTLHYPT